MPRNISSDETKAFIDWLEDEHEISFCDPYGSEINKDKVKTLWDMFVNGD